MSRPNPVITVWAPRADRADVVIGLDPNSPQRIPMAQAGNGYFAAEISPDTVGYWISLDGGPARPDPRSRWQPDGVLGASRPIDLTEFEWTDRFYNPPPFDRAILYELHVGTFTPEGTFASAIERLPELVDLGVTHIELMPIAEFSGDHGWGYDGALLFAPHHAYGGPAGLARLVDAAHAAGLAVILDVVYNHLGPVGNYLAEFGPYMSDRHRTAWGDAVNLDGPDSDQVRRFFIDNAIMWLADYHFDGLRLDAVHALVDSSARHFVEQLADEVRILQSRVRKAKILIAECNLNDPRYVRMPEIGGYGLDSAWADDFHHALHAYLTGERDSYYEDFGELGQLATALGRGWVFAGDYSIYRRRVYGRDPVGLSGERFIVFAQNHDQIGNRALGERIGMLVGPARTRIAAALTILAPFTPMLFQGEEWAASTPFLYFTDHRDPALGQAVTEGRRAEFAEFTAPSKIPDPQDRATFDASVLGWQERDEPAHRQMLEWYKALIELRRTVPALAEPNRDDCSIGADPASGMISMRRGQILVVVNLGQSAGELAVGTGRMLLESGAELRDGRVRLDPDGVAIVEVEEDPA